MQQLVDRFDDPAYAVRADPKLTIDAWNHAIEQALGWTAKEAVGRPAIERLRPTIGRQSRARRVESLRRHGWWVGRTVLLDRDEREVAFDGMCYPTWQGEELRFVTVLRRLVTTSIFPQIAETVKSTTPEQIRHVVLAGIDRTGHDGATSHDMSAVDNRKLVGHNIRVARDAIADPPLRQEQLADRLGVLRHQLSDWERGRFRPRDETLERIAEICGVPGAPEIGWFFNSHDEQAA